MTTKLKRKLEQLKADAQTALTVISFQYRGTIRDGVNWADLDVVDVYSAKHLDGAEALHIVIEEASSPQLEAAVRNHLHEIGWSGDVRVRSEW